MRLSQFFKLVIIVTGFSLLYVYQQSEIFRLAYAGQKRQAYLEELLDKNSLLRYNIQRKASLVQLGKTASQSTDYEMPQGYYLVKFSPPPEGSVSRRQVAKETLFARIFGIKRQAEAQTFNP